MGRFPIIFSESEVFLKFLCVNTLPILSPLTTALHVMDLILNFLLLHCVNLGAFGLCFCLTKNIGKWTAAHPQEGAGAGRSSNKTHQKLHQ